MPQLAQVNENMNLTSAMLVRHFSNSESGTVRQPMAFRPSY